MRFYHTEGRIARGWGDFFWIFRQNLKNGAEIKEKTAKYVIPRIFDKLSFFVMTARDGAKADSEKTRRETA